MKIFGGREGGQVDAVTGLLCPWSPPAACLFRGDLSECCGRAVSSQLMWITGREKGQPLAQHKSLLFPCCYLCSVLLTAARMCSEKCQSKHITHHTHHTRTHAHTLQTLQDFHPLTFRIKSRCPPITHQGQHDLVTVSDLLPDILPFCPAHPALHTLALAYPDLGAFMLAAHSAWTQLSPLWLPLGWLFSSNWFLLKWHPLGEAFLAHKSLKIALHPSSIFQSLPWLYFHCRTHSLWKCIAY